MTNCKKYIKMHSKMNADFYQKEIKKSKKTNHIKNEQRFSRCITEPAHLQFFGVVIRLHQSTTDVNRKSRLLL